MSAQEQDTFGDSIEVLEDTTISAGPVDEQNFRARILVLKTDSRVYRIETQDRNAKTQSDLRLLLQDAAPVNFKLFLPKLADYPELQKMPIIKQDSVDDSMWIKDISLQDLPDFARVQTAILGEARVCALLFQHPHPNIVPILGSLEDTVDLPGYLRGLVLARLPATLHDAKSNGTSVDNALVIADLTAALSHLHGLGFAHVMAVIRFS